MKQFEQDKQKLMNFIHQFEHEITDTLKTDIYAKLFCLKPKVKQLEWKETTSGTWECYMGWQYYQGGKGSGDAIKGYTIIKYSETVYTVYINDFNELPIGQANTLKEAKQIAQEHYEQLILGALE